MVTLTTIEYRKLKQKAESYDRIIEVAQTELFVPPPITDRKKVISALRGTKLYNQKFLISVNRGLKRSKYFTN